MTRLTRTHRSKAAVLSIEFVLRAPGRQDTTKVVLHQITSTRSLSDITKDIAKAKSSRVESAGAVTDPPWVADLLVADEGELEPILFLLPNYHSPGTFRTLDSTKSLDTALRKSRFIEWPTVHIWRKDDWEEHCEQQKTGPPQKKAKLGDRAASKVLSGLVGSYNSDEDSGSDEDADAEGEAEGLASVLEYGSDGEDDYETQAHASVTQYHTMSVDEEEILDWGDAEEEMEKDEQLIEEMARSGRVLQPMAAFMR